jgi:hypothetical protein
MRLKSYEKIKLIIAKYYGSSLSKKEIVDDNITNDNVRETIKKLNKMNILSSNVRGFNKLKETIFNRNIFKLKDYNLSIIASLAYSDEKNSKEIVNYIFNDVPKIIIKNTIKRYSENLDTGIENLFNETYTFFYNHLILESENTRKTVVFLKTHNSSSDYLILSIFLKDDDIFICTFKINNEKFKIINLKEIISAKITTKFYEKYISSNDMYAFIENYLDSEVETNYFFKLKPSILSHLISQNIISEYYIYEDIKEEKLFFSTAKEQKVNKININQLKFIQSNLFKPNNHISSFNSNEMIIFNEIEDKNYIVQSKINKRNFEFIKCFMGVYIEFLDVDE